MGFERRWPRAARPERRGQAIEAVRAAPRLRAGSDPAEEIAGLLIESFDEHYRRFRATSARAKQYSEVAAWAQAQLDVKVRIDFDDDRVVAWVARVRGELDPEALPLPVWRRAKLRYLERLVDHSQPELAETFYNSVVTRILQCSATDDELIFARSVVSTENVPSDPPVYRCYYPTETTLLDQLELIFRDFGWRRPFADLAGDVGRLVHALEAHRGAPWPYLEPNHQIQVLGSAFYRNTPAYVVGKIINGYEEQPFVVPVLNDGANLSLDAIVLDQDDLNVLFSLSRAYCMVDMASPSGYVKFLRRMMPTKARAELYTMLGLGKHGKTLFHRDFRQHLGTSADAFVHAPGIDGKVMLVFTLPSYPYVFKVIKDVFGPGKETDRATVEAKFAMVKHVDRVGRMADTLEFTDLALPRERFSPELLEQLALLAPSMIVSDDPLVIRHCYVERRMVPLNIYLDRATPAELESAVRDYGNAIRDLAIANIFPGDMLWRNFGVTRSGRVVFYDYDEIEYLTTLSFRRIPPAPHPEAELADEPWYSVSRNDVFPEEFATFLLSDPRLREPFMRHHAALLDIAFWEDCQRRIRAGEIVDFFPYPETLRFSDRDAA